MIKDIDGTWTLTHYRIESGLYEIEELIEGSIDDATAAEWYEVLFDDIAWFFTSESVWNSDVELTFVDDGTFETFVIWFEVNDFMGYDEDWNGIYIPRWTQAESHGAVVWDEWGLTLTIYAIYVVEWDTWNEGETYNPRTITDVTFRYDTNNSKWLLSAWQSGQKYNPEIVGIPDGRP
jgi:hypothetical protein